MGCYTLKKTPSELPAEDKPTHMLQHASSLHSNSNAVEAAYLHIENTLFSVKWYFACVMKCNSTFNAKPPNSYIFYIFISYILLYVKV